MGLGWFSLGFVFGMALGYGAAHLDLWRYRRMKDQLRDELRRDLGQNH